MPTSQLGHDESEGTLFSGHDLGRSAMDAGNSVSQGRGISRVRSVRVAGFPA
jgi:hypothetical protein